MPSHCASSRILLVTSRDGLALSLGGVLADAGFETRLVKEADLVVETALAESPALVLLDAEFSPAGGFEVCRRLKRERSLQSVPVIFISASASVDDRVEAIRAGGVDCVARSTQDENLTDLVARARAYVRLHAESIELPFQRLRVSADCPRERLQLEALSHGIRDALIVVDHEGKVSLWNQAAERMFGHTATEALGHELHELISTAQSSEAVAQEVWRFVTSQGRCGAGRTIELAGVDKNGSEFPMEMSLTQVLVDGERGVVGLIRDISQRRRAETLLLREMQRREGVELELRHAQKLESVGRLAAGIAHEINTPSQFVTDNVHFLRDAFTDITRIIGAAKALTDHGTPSMQCLTDMRSLLEAADLGFLESEIPRAFDQTMEGLSRITKIVGAMKDFSRPSSAGKSPVDLNRAIESTVIVSRNEWKYVATLTTDLDPELPVVNCLGDEINQVILNLIVNAAHTIGEKVPEGTGAKGSIAISTRRQAAAVEIRIKDSGMGIPEAIRHRIFDPFFTTKPIGKGTGQGLAIAHSIIVDKHQGTIDFESVVGVGTTFVIRLPIEGGSA